jgi:hypothetical protein
MVQTKKTDNDRLAEKLHLRLKYTPDERPIKVLDAFAATGKLWDKVKENRKGQKIDVTRIDTNPRARGTLRGDNLKYLATLDLSIYDVIDLDAYGIPAEQLMILTDRGYSGRVFVTAIQSMHGCLPSCLLEAIGFSREMVKVCPSLFNTNGIEKINEFLGVIGVEKYFFYYGNRKLYCTFEM